MIPAPVAEHVLGYLGWSADALLTEQAGEHALQAAMLAKAYTRGRGFEVDPVTKMLMVEQDIASVIITYAARSLSNPTSAREIEAGAFRESPGSPWSFSLVETLVLNGYRRRAG